jgi:hypothetical protein
VEVAEVKGQYRTPSHPLVAALTAHLLAVVEVRVALTRPPSLLSRRVGREHIALSKCILSRPSRVATQPTLDEPPFVEQGARRFTVFGHCIVNCAFTHTHNLRALVCVLTQLRRPYFRRQAVAVTDLRPYHQNTCVTHKRE